MSTEWNRAVERVTTADAPATALPLECYRDPAFFEAEVERVLRPGWHAVARHDELPKPGDYRTIDLFGERIVLVRGADGVLRALSGLCRHRAFALTEGEGNAADGLVCPYHRWAYQLDGRLKGAPLMDDVAGFDPARCRLPALPLEIWQGFVMVSPDPDPQPLAPRLAALSDLLQPLGLAEAVQVDVADWDSPWNWKVMVENFIESYHHVGPHAASLGKSHPARGTHQLDVDGPCLVLENPAADGTTPFYVIQVFPTTLLAPTRGPFPLCAWYEMQIDRHDHLHLRIHALLPPGLAESEEVVEAARQTLRDVHLEDIPVCEGIQKGIESRVWRPGPLCGLESLLAGFHRHLAAEVGMVRAGRSEAE